MSAKPREARIRAWMKETISAGARGAFNDLHIDRIDDGWKNRSNWIDGGIEALRLAVQIRDSEKIAMDVAVAFSLISDEKPRGMNFHDVSSLFKQLDWSPPALYLLLPNQKPWEKGATSTSAPPSHMQAKTMSPLELGLNVGARAAYFMEFKTEESDEYARTVMLVG